MNSFDQEFNALSLSIQQAMESALVNVIRNTRGLAQKRMIAAFTDETAKLYFPHEEMTAEERKEHAMQWAQDASYKALKNLSASYVQSSILKTAIA